MVSTSHKSFCYKKRTLSERRQVFELYYAKFHVLPQRCVKYDTYYVPLWRRQWHPTPVLLPGKSHGRRGLEGCRPWGRWGSDTTERLHFHFSLSCIGEGHGNPLQCSCLENPRDRGAWWAAVYGVAQSRTRLKWLSSSSMCHCASNGKEQKDKVRPRLCQ